MAVAFAFVTLIVQHASAFGASARLPSQQSRVTSTRLAAAASGSRGQMSMRWGLKGEGSANKPTGDLPDGVTLRDTVPFELRGFSLPAVVFTAGFLLTATSFAGFFSGGGSDDAGVSSLGFVYGIPVFLIGLSLWYAEIQPVQVISSEKGDRAYEAKKTDTMIKIRQDVTRHRYGDDAHLDSTLESLGLKLPQKKFPKMQTIVLDETPEGELEYLMTFQSLETPYKVWAEPDRVRRYTSFFGPGVFAEVLKIDSEKRIVGIKLTTTTNGIPAAAAAAAAAAASSAAPADASEEGF